MDNAFASASAITDQRQKIEQYKHILSAVISSNDIGQARKFIDHSKLSFLGFIYFNFVFVFVLINIWDSWKFEFGFMFQYYQMMFL